MSMEVGEVPLWNVARSAKYRGERFFDNDKRFYGFIEQPIGEGQQIWVALPPRKSNLTFSYETLFPDVGLPIAVMSSKNIKSVVTILEYVSLFGTGNMIRAARVSFTNSILSV